MNNLKPKSIDEYIEAFPKEIRSILQQIRETIKKAAPEADETISYNMPAFKMKKVLVYFAAYKNHIGSIQFSLNEKIPFDLIKKIVEFRVKEISK